MDIETAGAIRLFFPNPSLTLVYFEALANALDAGATDVSIDIDVQAFDKPDTLKIAVSDNGDGFTDENFERFRKLLRPRDKFHKGIGRLVFLNYFSRVEVTSTRDKWRRSFVFKDGFDGNAPLENLKDEQPAKTTLVFNGFAKDRVKSYDDLKPDALKPLLIEQFLPTLDARKRDGTAFKISINLKTKESNAQKEFFPHETVITTDDLPSMTKITIQDDSLDAFSTIDMLYHVEPVSGKGSLLAAFSIDGRTIPVNLIPTSSFPPGYMGVFLFESEMFHSNADSSRQKLILPESLPVEKLYRVLRREVGKVLADKIPKITEKRVRLTRRRRPSSGSGLVSVSPRAVRRSITPLMVATSIAVSRPSWFCEHGPVSASFDSAAHCVGVRLVPISRAKIAVCRCQTRRRMKPICSSRT